MLGIYHYAHPSWSQTPTPCALRDFYGRLAFDVISIYIVGFRPVSPAKNHIG